MQENTKSKIYQLLDSIDDEGTLNQVMEDVAFYAKKEDVVDELSPEQLEDLDKAITEADNDETISWEGFKKELGKWKEK